MIFQTYACMHDDLCCTDIRLKSWQREFVGTTVMYSSILNLHQPKKQLPDKGIYNNIRKLYIGAIIYNNI